MATHARGTFDVKVVPQPPEAGIDPAVARMTIDKQFHGDIEGTSRGQMLSVGDPSKGSAGYVAMELVTGTLSGQRGTFVLQHTGTMTPGGGGELVVTVVPGSGTEQLAGLSGRLSIEIVDKKHLYDFEYALPGTGR